MLFKDNIVYGTKGSYNIVDAHYEEVSTMLNSIVFFIMHMDGEEA